MRAYIALLIPAVLIATLSAAGKSQENLTVDYTSVSLSQKVKMLSVLEEKLSMPAKELSNSYVFFDSCGRVKTIKQVEGSEESTHTYSYNDSGLLTQLRIRYTVGNETVRVKTCRYTYNRYNQPEEEHVVYTYVKPYSPGQESVVAYHYSDSTLLAKYTINNQETILFVNYQYDSFGRLTGERCFTPQGIQTQQVTYTYNEQGKLSGKSLFDSSQSLAYTESYLYSPQGLMVQKRCFDSYQNAETIHTYSYSEQGLLTEQTVTYSSQPHKQQHIRYSYDDQGSWLNQVTYIDGKAESRTSRTVTYEQPTLAER